MKIAHQVTELQQKVADLQEALGPLLARHAELTRALPWLEQQVFTQFFGSHVRLLPHCRNMAVAAAACVCAGRGQVNMVKVSGLGVTLALSRSSATCKAILPCQGYTIQALGTVTVIPACFPRPVIGCVAAALESVFGEDHISTSREELQRVY
jgi:hypothetical protein